VWKIGLRGGIREAMPTNSLESSEVGNEGSAYALAVGLRR